MEPHIVCVFSYKQEVSLELIAGFFNNFFIPLGIACLSNESKHDIQAIGASFIQFAILMRLLCCFFIDFETNDPRYFR